MIGLKSYFYDFNWSIIYAVTGVMLYSIGLKIVISIVYFMRADNTWVWWTREMTIVYRRFYYRVLSQGICYDKNHVTFANQNKRKNFNMAGWNYTLGKIQGLKVDLICFQFFMYILYRSSETSSTVYVMFWSKYEIANKED